MINITRNSIKLTDKKTIEKDVILKKYKCNIDTLKQEFNCENDTIYQILEHEINNETYSILEILIAFDLLDLYVNEIKAEHALKG